MKTPEVIETLLYYDGPLIEVLRDDAGQLYYSHFLDLEAGVYTYGVVRITPEQLTAIKNDTTDLRTILIQKPSWVMTQDGDHTVMLPAGIPADCMPEPGVFLHPSYSAE